MSDSLLDSLKFVKGGVTRKDHVQVLTHFSIKDQRITAYNGIVAISSPIAFAIDCQPKAEPFTKAIGIVEAMESTPILSMTPSGRLTVKAGGFKTHIECSADSFPELATEGEPIPLECDLLSIFKVLEPLIAEDASRPWARGILIRAGSAFATNNCVLGQYWIGVNFPFDINVPDECVREILRVKQPPIAISATARSVCFYYDDGRWIKSQLLTTDWPDLGPVLDNPCSPTPIPSDFFDILERLSPYADASRKVYLRGNLLSTSLLDGIGASHETDGFADDIKGAYNIDLLRVLDGLVAEVDFSRYPKPSLFFGPATDSGYPLFRGAIVGMKER